MGKQKTLIVIGGGAAGFFCAVNAARLNSGLKVIIVEKSSKLLSKVKISGGGRCNVTHACFDIQALSKNYPRGQQFVKKSFHWFSTKDTLTWYLDRNVQLQTEKDGRIFPLTNSAQTIIDCLLQEAVKYSVEIITNCSIDVITKNDKSFDVHTKGRTLPQADYVCVACGGFAKAEQFNWLKNINHSIELPVPSLFTFNIPDNRITSLMGVSVEQAIIKIAGTKFQQHGAVLITHWGLSGPAVLKLSAFAAKELAANNYQFSVIINWLSNYNEHTLRNDWSLLRQGLSAQKIYSKNPFALPNRLWNYFLQMSGIDDDKTWSDITTKQQNQLIQQLTAQNFQISGKTTFKEEFVTCGGIKLSEINPNTMESKIVANLFFAGEIMDVDGITGGFNFQHAWTSGWIAANAIAKNY